ncbi:MAG TPA: Fe2+-dependent dioxygenase [Alphaproteobacteria bacterium]|nr:Fe2+-dependent dioxygenase [Alphaproteobacteria bacterium]|tara:strand:+ start:121 stop:783 length:663 start_codon:yes stop_codon:yes gene_type:complete
MINDMKIIDDLFDEDVINRILEVTKNVTFEDGDKTLAAFAKGSKKNKQLLEHNAPKLIQGLKSILLANQDFHDFTWPSEFGRPTLSKYGVGSFYKWHNDAAFMGNVRADYSFTIGINSCDEYEGGELRLKTAEGIKEVRLQPGQGIVYSTGLLHEVAEVTAGERFVMIGWIQSRVRDPRHKEVLNSLSSMRKNELSENGRSETFINLTKVWADLQRLWLS